MPKEVINANLKKEEMIARDNKTTKHAPEMVDINANSASTSQQKNKEKPLPICEYNKGKAGIDYPDQTGSYATTFRKGIKWYRKL